MHNSQTDSLGLIECVVVKEARRLFGRVPIPSFVRTLPPLPGKHKAVLEDSLKPLNVFNQPLKEDGVVVDASLQEEVLSHLNRSDANTDPIELPLTGRGA